MDSEGRLQHEP